MERYKLKDSVTSVFYENGDKVPVAKSENISKRKAIKRAKSIISKVFYSAVKEANDPNCSHVEFFYDYFDKKIYHTNALGLNTHGERNDRFKYLGYIDCFTASDIEEREDVKDGTLFFFFMSLSKINHILSEFILL